MRLGHNFEFAQTVAVAQTHIWEKPFVHQAILSRAISSNSTSLWHFLLQLYLTPKNINRNNQTCQGWCKSVLEDIMRLLTLSLLDTNNLPVPHLTFSVRLIATKSEPGRRETPTLPWRGAMSTLHTFWRCRVHPSRWKDPSIFFLSKEGINQKIDRPAKAFFPWFMNISSQDPNFSRKDGHFAREFLWNFQILKQTVGGEQTYEMLMSDDWWVFVLPGVVWGPSPKQTPNIDNKLPQSAPTTQLFIHPWNSQSPSILLEKKLPSHHCKTRASQKTLWIFMFFSSFTRCATIFPISFL